MQRLMVLVVDSFNPTVLHECMKKGSVPALSFLANNGHISSAVSTFPTMTPTASATIATGKHCDEHHVPGFIWYDEKASYFVNYGASPHALFSLGPIKAFTDLFYSLNDKQLNPELPTIFEELEDQGIPSACINFFIRRGYKKYNPKYHWLMNAFRALGLKKDQIQGPQTLIWGQVVGISEKSHPLLPRGVFNKFGVNDSYTSSALCNLIRTQKLPPFSIAFFPDNDRYSHVHGPLQTAPSIEKVDRHVGEILSAFGSWEKALKECHFIIIGDHSQSQVERKNIIRLDNILKKYRISPKKFTFGKDSQLVVSANERMTSINILDKSLNKDKLINILSGVKKLGLIMWKDKLNYYVLAGQNKLVFKKDGPISDRNNLTWEVAGDLAALDAQIKDNKISFFSNPDALERIAAALDFGTQNKLLLSAPLGYEYYIPGAPIHPGGGSHGSLHIEDSIVPVISAGQGRAFLGQRTVEIKNYVKEFFALEKGIRERLSNSLIN